MRIVFTIIDANLAGGQRVALELMENLRSGGSELFAAFPGEGPLEAAVRRIGVQREHIPSWRLRDPRGYLALARAVARTRPDLIYTHCGGGGEFIAVVVGKLWRIPVVIHRHSIPGFSGPPLRQGLERALMRWAYRSASGVIAVSNATYRAIAELGVPTGHVTVIMNGIPIDKFVSSSPNARARIRAEFGFQEDSVVACLIGRLCENKGQRVLLEAARRLPCSQLRLRFLFVGKDQEQGGCYQAYLRRLASEYGLSDCVVFAGRRQRIPDVLAASDLTVLPSNADACPMSVLESMAAKKAVVATATTGACEILEHGVTGLIVPIGDPTSLAQAILRLVQDASLRASLVGNAYAQVIAKHSGELFLENVMGVLSHAAGQCASVATDAMPEKP